MVKRTDIDMRGARYCPDFLDRAAQVGLVQDLRDVVRAAQPEHGNDV